MVFLAAADVTGLLYRALDRGFASLGCYHSAPADRFMAYCASPQFGDYEHGAYYYDLEPEALDHLKHADVVFFGTSRAQIALSTSALSSFFALHAMTPYLFGFGYGEYGAFPLAIMRKYDVKPKAIVILADPFFKDRTWWRRWRWFVPELYEYTQKQIFIALGSRLCAVWPSVCMPRQVAIYRSRADGSWQTFGFALDERVPITESSKHLYTHTALEAGEDIAFAARFIAATGVARECVVLSAAPGILTSRDSYVSELGRRLVVRLS